MSIDNKRDEIFYCMSKISDSIKRKQSPTFIKTQIDRLKEIFSDDEYILSLIDDLYFSNYQNSKYDALNKELKSRGLTF